MSLYDRSKQQRTIPKPRYKCEHVKAGFLTAARIDLDRWTIDVCQACFDSKAFMDLTDNNDVVRLRDDVL